MSYRCGWSGTLTVLAAVTQSRWDYVKCPDSRHLRSHSTKASRAIISPGGWGDKTDGSLWRALPDTVSHTFSPYIVPSWTPWRPGGHSLSPAALGWPALLDCRMRMTAYYIGTNIDDVELRNHRPECAYRPYRPTTCRSTTLLSS